MLQGYLFPWKKTSVNLSGFILSFGRESLHLFWSLIWIHTENFGFLAFFFFFIANFRSPRNAIFFANLSTALKGCGYQMIKFLCFCMPRSFSQQLKKESADVDPFCTSSKHFYWQHVTQEGWGNSWYLKRTNKCPLFLTQIWTKIDTVEKNGTFICPVQWYFFTIETFKKAS